MTSGSQSYTVELPVAPREKDDSNKRAAGTGRVPQTVKSVLTSAPAVHDVPETSASRSQPLTSQERVAVATRRINEEASGPKKMVSLKILEKYKGCPDILTGKKQRDEWLDSYLTSKDYVDVADWFRYDRNGRKELLETALSSLTKRVSAQSVGAILVGAWGLRSCEDTAEYVFELKKPKMTNVGVPATNLQESVICEVDNGKEYRYIPPTYAEKEPDYYELWERSATYICAALLRMVVKEERNIKNAWDYIKATYKGFYKEDILMNITPNLSCLTSIRLILQSKTLVKDTIGVFLLAFNDLVGKDKGLCQMLYARQMCYTGMHAYSLSISCADKLGVPLSTLVALLKHPINGKALEAIAMLHVTYEFPQNLEARKKLEKGKTWKYARIFDEEAFSSIQTKNCEMLTSILATISQKLGTEGAGDATKIRQIAGFVENRKDWLEAVAQKVINSCLEAGRLSEDMMSGVQITER